MNGRGDDFARLPFRVLPRLFERTLGDPGGIQTCLTFHFLQQVLLRLVGGHSRHAFQRLAMFFFSLRAGQFLRRQLLLPPCQFLLALLRVDVALIQNADPLVDRFLSQHKTLLDRGQFRQLGFLFLFRLRFGLKNKILGFKLGFFDDIFRFALGILHDVASLFLLLSPLRRR